MDHGSPVNYLIQDHVRKTGVKGRDSLTVAAGLLLVMLIWSLVLVLSALYLVFLFCLSSRVFRVAAAWQASCFDSFALTPCLLGDSCLLMDVVSRHLAQHFISASVWMALVESAPAALKWVWLLVLPWDIRGGFSWYHGNSVKLAVFGSGRS